jgi:NitT/TauT family transport system substrate-binding protein
LRPTRRTRRPRIWLGSRSGVGYHSGSHYSAIQGLERFLDRDQIKLRFSGTPHDRTRLLLGRKVPAVNVFGAQFYIMEQLGFRKIVDTTFRMGFLLAADVDLQDSERYFQALRRAQQEIDLEPEPYKHYYGRELPSDLLALVDVRRFGPGERIVFEPYTKEVFEESFRWIAERGIFPEGGMGAGRYEDAVLSLRA